MIIDEDIYLEHYDNEEMTTTDEEVDAFLEHFGVKGMRWGVTTRTVGRGTVRTAKTVGRETARAAKAVGRGTVKTAKFVNRNRVATAAVVVAVGAVAAGIILKQRGQGSYFPAVRHPSTARGRTWVAQPSEGKAFDIRMQDLRAERQRRGERQGGLDGLGNRGDTINERMQDWPDWYPTIRIPRDPSGRR